MTVQDRLFYKKGRNGFMKSFEKLGKKILTLFMVFAISMTQTGFTSLAMESAVSENQTTEDDSIRAEAVK